MDVETARCEERGAFGCDVVFRPKHNRNTTKPEAKPRAFGEVWAFLPQGYRQREQAIVGRGLICFPFLV